MKYRLAITSYSISKYAHLITRKYSSKVPLTPVITLEKKEQEKVKVDANTISLLERLSLVKCDTAEGVKVLEDSITFANKILHINTDNVEPLYSVLENENLYLREDKITQGGCQKEILRNAAVTEDDYFVAPPGNIPLHEITTTPGLFSVNDVKHEDDNTHANISASFNWGHWTVETVKMSSSKKDSKNSTLLCCSTSLEKSLITLLLDATTNSTKEEYLRLHNKMAPYKISFALSHTEKTHVSSLQELATQIYYKLLSNKISAWLPNFSLPFEPQIKENLQMGATYTAILSEPTLSTGIFHLMNSSTMLKEQVHVADFVNYAALLCGNRI
ncbi:uncharacterized protein GatC isoform X2 [Epargyreus clarus]|uniref:uncharacterized protein GatC isoform X2 n=1 Tax=Epargyreus clarus TaxID=520877 RepID=UPI003C2C8000